MWFTDEEEQRDAAAAAACANGPVESSGPVPIPGAAAAASAAGRPSLGPIGSSRKSSAQWRRESVTIVEGVEEAALADAEDEVGLELDKEPIQDDGPVASTQLTLNAPQQQKGEITGVLVLVIKR